MRWNTTNDFQNALERPVAAIIAQMPIESLQYGFRIPSYAHSIRARDYAKQLLHRLRYLKSTYVRAYVPGGVSPSPEAFRDAEQFVLKLPLRSVGIPFVSVASDGEINFDWTAGNVRIDLGFYGDGRYSFFARNADAEALGDDIAIVDDVPADLLHIASS